MASPFESTKEFREVMDRVFTIMSEDPQMGPRLRYADVPQRFEFDDVDLVMNIRAGKDGEDANLYWEWTDDVAWSPRVRMTMSSETANRYFQGRENVPMAIARRRIKTGGDIKASLEVFTALAYVFCSRVNPVSSSKSDIPRMPLSGVRIS